MYFVPTFLTGKESYEVLGQEGRSTFDEIMDLQSNGIRINTHHHEVDVLLTCDWKCLCTIQGQSLLVNYVQVRD